MDRIRKFGAQPTFRCPDPECRQKIRKVRVDDHPEGVHAFVWQCSGCFREFGPEWSENGEETLLLGAELWTEEPQDETPLKLTVAEQSKPHQFLPDGATMRVLTALALAALSLLVVIYQLGKPYQKIIAVLQSTLI
jgi:hypothetical protein